MTSSQSLYNRIRELLGYRELLRNLVVRDLEVKYKGSALGFLWSLLHPLMMLLVYYFAFEIILGMRAANFPIYFIAGYLPWAFFVMSATIGSTSILFNPNLVQKVYFPREILPLSVVLANFIEFLLTLVIMVPAIYVTGERMTWTALFFPAVAILQVMFVMGFAMLMAAATVYFRDIKYLLEILLNLWFWVTPIVYTMDRVCTADRIPELLRQAYMLNPMTLFVVAYRDIFLGNYRLKNEMAQTLFITDPMHWAKMSGFAVVMLLLGYLVFQHCSRRFAESL